jgi:hypothetical protein
MLPPDAGDVAAGLIEAGDETQPDRIAAGAEDNGNCRGRRLGREHGRSTSARDDHAHRPADQKAPLSNSIVVTICYGQFRQGLGTA